MTRRSFACLALVGFLGFLNLLSHGDPATVPSATAPVKLTFLTGEEKAWSDFPKKPLLGSDTDKADLKTVLSIQTSRTEAQKSEAIKDRHYQLILVTDVIDPAFATKYPHIYAVIDEVDKDGSFVITKLKTENARLRPYQQHPTEIQPLFATPGFSYPSGHASGMELQARILGTVFHANGQDALLLKRAQQIADSRVVAGVHYPSDVKEGIILGDLLFATFGANPKFTEAMTAAAKADHVSTP